MIVGMMKSMIGWHDEVSMIMIGWYDVVNDGLARCMITMAGTCAVNDCLLWWEYSCWHDNVNDGLARRCLAC